MIVRPKRSVVFVAVLVVHAVDWSLLTSIKTWQFFHDATWAILYNRNDLLLILAILTGWLVSRTQHPDPLWLKRTSTSLTRCLLLSSGVQGVDLVIIKSYTVVVHPITFHKISIKGSKVILLPFMTVLVEPAFGDVAATDCQVNHS